MNLTLTPIRFKQRAVREYGNKIGIVDGDKRFTYAQYGERCDRFSNALNELGVQRGERVAIHGCHRASPSYMLAHNDNYADQPTRCIRWL